MQGMFGNPANAQFMETGKPFIQPNYQPLNIPIPFLQTMDTNARSHFKPSLNAINGKKVELARLAKQIQTSHGPLNAAIRGKQGMKALNIGDKSFRGKNGPLVYVAPEGNDYVVRGNFMESGYPFRVTNPNSFNAVLRNMKAKRRNVTGKLTSLKSLTAQTETLERQYAAKQAELAKLVKGLQKEHEEYLAGKVKAARGTRRTILPSSAPITGMSATARQELLPPSASTPGFFSRMFGRKGGATRRRRGSRKTRKTNRR